MLWISYAYYFLIKLESLIEHTHLRQNYLNKLDLILLRKHLKNSLNKQKRKIEITV